MATVISPQLIKDPADPTPGADAAQNEIAGNLEHEIADVKNARAERIGLFRHVEIVQHLQAGKADVDAVEDVDDVKQEQKRQQPPGDLP